MSTQSTTISDELIEQIRLAVKESGHKDAVVDTIVDALLDAKVDLRSSPSLDQMKRLLAEAYCCLSDKTTTV